ncbi:hypothetical protein SPI_08467 [Niveomyces insectorum RCEF 264]|uniref:Domain of unknown function at the cortex 1 domain-containing protein n=1 Tax=Niveomyces insectorum RCEF 264 TaxID=1081102 RepID=A0A167MZY4_9HYPO|nr:hypothetical protein SPI_08467 [Niveomyces insectorum RCEF 264]
MANPSDYVLRVTAGTDYDPATHVAVRVNDPQPVRLRGAYADVAVNVRIRDYRGPLDGTAAAAPATSPYFDAAPHKANDDTYSIALWFAPKRGDSGDCGGGDDDDDDNADIAGHNLQWGNDFDRPIRDLLPPGFGTALRIVKWWIDPGLAGDPYADRPYLYGPALSSFNEVYVAGGDKGERSERSEDGHERSDGMVTKQTNERSEDENTVDKDWGAPVDPDKGLWFGEGGDEAGLAWRTALGCPATDGAARRAWALREGTAPTGAGSSNNGGDAVPPRQWTWRRGTAYGLDFYNGYLDFDRLALRLPGFRMPLLRYWDGQQSLRYVLRNRRTETVYLVVAFHLERRAVDEKEEAAAADIEDDDDTGHDTFDEAAALAEAERHLSAAGDMLPDIHDDDVD